MNSKTSQSFTIAIDANDKVCTVAPSQQLVAINDNVTFLNLSQGKVTILFPDANPFGVKSVDLAESGAGSSATLPVIDVGFGSYYYDVYNHKNGIYASKGAQPIIIVYPR